jgi:hypothetical protein
VASSPYRTSPVVTAPAAPVDLNATVDGTTATLQWTASNDDQTPSSGLTYNLSVGTAPGAVDVMSPMASLAAGLSRLPALGNAQHGTTAVLKSLRPGTYYWTVQAVDTAFSGSPFAAGGSFAVTQVPLTVTRAGTGGGIVSSTRRDRLRHGLHGARRRRLGDADRRSGCGVRVHRLERRLFGHRPCVLR